jgi:hypothetical protein
MRCRKSQRATGVCFQISPIARSALRKCLGEALRDAGGPLPALSAGFPALAPLLSRFAPVLSPFLANFPSTLLARITA